MRLNGIPDEQNATLKELERQTNTLRNYLLGIEERKSLYEFSRVRDVDVAVEIGKGIIDAAALAAGIVMTGPAGVFVGLGIDSLAIALCIEHGDDEEAVARTVGVIAGMGAGAVVKYADEIVELGDDVIETAYDTGVKSIDFDDGFKGFDFDTNNGFFKNADDVVDGGTSIFKYTEVKTFTAEETNQWFIDNVKPDYKPPYKPGTMVEEIELTETTTFVRVYDNMPNGSGMYGSWVMKAEDIEGLTPQEIQNKFALPNTPKYVCDVELEAGTHIRVGEVNALDGWGSGGGTQYDLIGQRIGDFKNERLLEGN